MKYSNLEYYELKKKIKNLFFYKIIIINFLRLKKYLFTKYYKLIDKQFIPNPKNIIYIEPTSKCNLKCKFCGYVKRNLDEHPYTSMDIDLFKKTVDKIILSGYENIGLTPVTGDVFMDKKIHEKFKYLERKKINYQFYTNFVALNEIDIDLIFDYKFLRKVNISLYGHDKSTFVAFTKSNEVSYKRLINNLNYIKKKINDGYNFKLILDHRTEKNFFLSNNDSDLSKCIKSLMSLNNIEYNYQYDFNNWGGMIKDKDIQDLNIDFRKLPIKKNGACSLIFSKLIIGANGNINACACRDANFSLRIGNIKNQKLEEIISKKNPAYMNIIENQEKGNFADVCKSCDFYDSIYLKKKNCINKKDFLKNI